MTIQKNVVRPFEVDSGRGVVPLSDSRLPAVIEEPDQFAGPAQTFQPDLNTRSRTVDMSIQGEMEKIMAVASAWIRRAVPDANPQGSRRVGAPRGLMVGKRRDFARQVDMYLEGLFTNFET